MKRVTCILAGILLAAAAAASRRSGIPRFVR